MNMWKYAKIVDVMHVHESKNRVILQVRINDFSTIASTSWI
jgi:hypothetical protein